MRFLNKIIAEGGSFYVLYDKNYGYLMKMQGSFLKYTNDKYKAWKASKLQTAENMLNKIKSSNPAWVTKELLITEL